MLRNCQLHLVFRLLVVFTVFSCHSLRSKDWGKFCKYVAGPSAIHAA